ncbi:hypothetical protein AALF15_11465 [Corynebacteriaceae bacterium 7-707]
MADQNNPGQFGNRKDTEEQAHRGGEASTGSFGDRNAADPHEAGREGAEAQSTEDKAKGGRHSGNGS